MRDPELKYKKLVLVCLNQRDNGRECCKEKGSEEIFYALKTQIAALDPQIRVSKAGCLGNCLSGVSVVIMPDDKWLGNVTLDDVPKIIEMLNIEKKDFLEDFDILS